MRGHQKKKKYFEYLILSPFKHINVFECNLSVVTVNFINVYNFIVTLSGVY